MKLKASTIFTVFLLTLVVVSIVTATGYPLRARVGPLAAGVPAAMLLIVQIVLDMRRKTKTDETETEIDADNGSFRSHITAAAWIAGLLAGTYLFGILITFTLFTLAYVKAAGWKWSLSIGLAAFVFVLLYGIFGLALQVPLHSGIFLE